MDSAASDRATERMRNQAQADAAGCAFLKGQRYNLLRNKQNLSAGGRADLKELRAANDDLSVVYVLKDAFKQVWTSTCRKRADKCLSGWIGMARAASLNSNALPAAYAKPRSKSSTSAHTASRALGSKHSTPS